MSLRRTSRLGGLNCLLDPPEVGAPSEAEGGGVRGQAELPATTTRRPRGCPRQREAQVQMQVVAIPLERREVGSRVIVAPLLAGLPGALGEVAGRSAVLDDGRLLVAENIRSCLACFLTRRHQGLR